MGFTKKFNKLNYKQKCLLKKKKQEEFDVVADVVVDVVVVVSAIRLTTLHFFEPASMLDKFRHIRLLTFGLDLIALDINLVCTH